MKYILSRVNIDVKVYNGKENEQLVLFVNEHCWLFFCDYYLANTKQMKQRIIKMARAFLRS